ncbi:Pilus assembly protein, ATPase of CpaF family [Actinacidiphila yanglinensis]|uniref:Pilus assembly protein, ATPase of CpaF family n=1 Tax=Actinacidiphila yanglinensis TaxID=310779 RepID=A0A1H6DM84_9ACTN|nr:Pilus assembly protein, ATPase of CpaF family [Actinacidiphila yanglinensis]
MRANPLHVNPGVAPIPPRWHQGPPTVSPAVVGRAAAPGTVGAPVPQAVVDYEAVRLIKKSVGERLTALLHAQPGMSPAAQEQQGRALINEQVAIWADGEAIKREVSTTAAEDAALAQAVWDLQFRAGRLQQHMDNTAVENIFINGFEQVWLDFTDGRRTRVPPVADSDEELRELLRDLARRTTGQNERSLSTADPFLALRLADGSRLQAVIDVTPGTYVTIRRHSMRHADLSHLVKLGMLDTTLGYFLRAAIAAEKNIMIVGGQAAGKTTLLRALLKEIPQDERFATLETEFELFAHENGWHRQVVPMEARESNGEMVAGTRAGEISLMDLMYRALRMSLARIVVGEVRGPEIVAMLQAMTNGQGGNLCTLHAIHPSVVFDRIAELYLLAQANMSESLAYRQAANGLHFIVFVNSVDETRIGGHRHRFVSHVLEVTGIGEGGRPDTNLIFGPRPEWGEDRAVPLMHPRCINDLRRAGFDADLLNEARGTWPTPLPLMIREAS